VALGPVAWTLGDRAGYYYLVLLIAVLATGVCALMLHSRVGRVLLAIRQNEALVEAMGVQAWRYKLMAFVVSASLAGLAGALYAHFIGFLNPDAFGVDHSLNAILAVILGGSGTLAGPVVGSFAVVFLPEYLRVAETYRLVIYGLVLVLATIFMPRGLVPLLMQALKWLAARLGWSSSP
jgi:branched-chain amino acid transport system permease protein